MAESARVQTTRKIIQAISDYDFDTVLSLVRPDLMVEVPFAALGMPRKLEGRDAFVDGLRFVPQMFKQFKLTITKVYDCSDQDTVIFEQKSRGVFQANDEVYENSYVMVFGFEGGEVVLWKEFFDSMVMTEAMGPILQVQQG